MKISINFTFNPYKPSVLFVGHRQTVQTQIRRHCLLTVSSIRIRINFDKNEKYYLTTLKTEMD